MVNASKAGQDFVTKRTGLDQSQATKPQTCEISYFLATRFVVV